MRPLEMLLLTGDVLIFVALTAPRLRTTQWARYAAAFTVFVLSAQVFLEGPRWQLTPLYVLGGILITLTQVPARAADAATGAPRLRRAAGFVGIGLVIVALIAAAALPALVPVMRLPRPTGPYEIGTLTYHWIDRKRNEVFSSNPSDRRELMVQVWYPALNARKLPRARYVPPGTTFAPLARLLHLPGFFFSHLRYVSSNAAVAAPAAGEPDTFPVLIFSPGRAGFRQHNSFQVEELVSHGYVVVAIDHPYAAAEVLFSDGRHVYFDERMLDRGFEDGIYNYLGNDAVFVLNQLAALNRKDPADVLTGRLDTGHVGIFGVSLGGIVAAEACSLDRRFQACLVMDALMPKEVIGEGLRQPTMWISGDAETRRREGWPAAAVEEYGWSTRAAFDKLAGDGYIVLLSGAYRANFSDFPLAISTPLARRAGLLGPIDARKAHGIIVRYSLAFFDRYLKQKPSDLLQGDAHDPAVSIEVRRR